MYLGSINIRGLGGSLKKQKVKGFITANHLDFVAVQETKLDLVDERLCHFLWGNKFCCWSFILAIGNSGGILSIWCSSKGNAVFSFFGPGFVGVCSEWGAARSRCFFVNVYSKCPFAEKRQLWSKLVKFQRTLLGDVWGVVGDFNAVIGPSERRSGVGPLVMRVDREMPQLWGPKPFRFNNYWLDHKTLPTVGDLKRWNKEVFGEIELKIRLEIESIKDFDLKAEAGPLSLEDEEARKHCLASMQRTRRNSIIALRVGDRWVESVPEVRAAILDYFKIHFSESLSNRPTLDGITFHELAEDDVVMLSAPFSAAEINVVVATSDGNKSRLAKEMDKLISPNQLAFIQGRKLVDGVVAVNEIIDLAKKSRKECLIFKVDFEKVYDSVSWSFLEYMMQRFGFGVRWRLKQGDPLAPFIFLLVVEGLSAAVRTAEERNLFTGFKVGNTGMFVSHLQYADDTLFPGEATLANLWSIKTILRGFELASGLKVNFGKSKVTGVNVSGDFLDVTERFLQCSRASLPFTYLGLPEGANARKLSTWKPLIDTISKKLGTWNN
ncbi:cytochrome P450, partial [Trifolium medium]|nr:cytochrome P450 [Trifolium medium]